MTNMMATNIINDDANDYYHRHDDYSRSDNDKFSYSTLNRKQKRMLDNEPCHPLQFDGIVVA